MHLKLIQLIFICSRIVWIILVTINNANILIICFQNAVHVSGGSSAHHQEHVTVRSASGIVSQCCCRLNTWSCVYSIVWYSGSSTIPAYSNIGWQYLKLCVQSCTTDDERRNRLKHVERFRNNQNICILLVIIKSKIEINSVAVISFHTGPSGRAVKGVGLRPLACWDIGFESRRWHGCLSVWSVVR